MHQFGYKFLLTKPTSIYMKHKSLDTVELDCVIDARNKKHALKQIRKLHSNFKIKDESDFLFLGRVGEWVRSLRKRPSFIIYYWHDFDKPYNEHDE